MAEEKDVYTLNNDELLTVMAMANEYTTISVLRELIKSVYDDKKKAEIFSYLEKKTESFVDSFFEEKSARERALKKEFGSAIRRMLEALKSNDPSWDQK